MEYNKKENNVAKYIIITIGLIIGLTVLGSFLSTPYSDTTNEPMLNRKDVLKQGFMSGCSPNGENKQACQCASDKVVDTYSEQQISDISKELETTGKIPQSFMDIIKSCIEEVGAV